jgi:ParB-like chromosome segregation protein Spo0J
MTKRKPPAGRKSKPALTWPADAVERRAVASLVPNARNARLHTETQIEQIAASIKEWGWTIPVLIDENGGIIAGHGRVLAAALLEIETVPAMVARGWSKAKKRAYMLADNKLALNSRWDQDLLKLEIDDLKKAGIDCGLIGFSETEIDSILGNVEQTTGKPQMQGLEYRLVVDCTSEGHQAELLQRLEGEGLKCRPLIS